MDLRTLITDPQAAAKAGAREGTTRRTFLKAAPLSGLVLGVGLPRFGFGADEPQKYGGDGMPHGLQDSP